MLICSNPLKELGLLTFGRPYFFNYIVKNESNVVVSIHRVVAGCSSCTIASADKEVLKPGEETQISVQFTPGNTGKQTKKIIVEYNAGNIPVKRPLTLTFKAAVND